MRWRPAAAAARLPGIVIVRFACGVPSQVADKVLHIMHEVDEAHDHGRSHSKEHFEAHLHSHLSAPKSNRVPEEKATEVTPDPPLGP